MQQLMQPTSKNRSVDVGLKRLRKLPHTPNHDLVQKIKELQEKLVNEQTKTEQLKLNLRRVERLLDHKSIQYEDTIKQLKEDLLNYRRCPSPSLESMNKSLDLVEKTHHQVLDALDGFKKECKFEFEVQQRDIIRAFDAKLAEICENFEERRRRKVEEVSKLVREEGKMSKELEILRGSAYMIQSKNQQLQDENKYLKSELECRETELNSALTKYFKLKRRVQQMNEPRPDERFYETPDKTLGMPSKPGLDQSRIAERYEGVIAKLRKQLEIERRNLRAARTAFSRELEAKTDMERLLRCCVEEARADIVLKKGTRRNETEEDRKLIMDKLLATEEVMRLLYDKAFPLSS